MAMADYRARARQFSLLSAVLLFMISNISAVSGQTEGVFLSLSGISIPNNGYVLISDISRNDFLSSLYCNTNRSDCCRGSDNPNGGAQGHWYHPDGREVMSYTVEYEPGSLSNFFFRNRYLGVVRLNRIGNPPERGRFRCEIPNASGDIVCLYANIVDEIPTIPPPTEPLTCMTTTTSQSTTFRTTQSTIPPPTTYFPETTDSTVNVITTTSITSSGTATAGERYSLECSVSVIGSTEQPTITWLDPINNQITSGVVTTGSMSTLTFNPLDTSHAGTYICRATLNSAIETASITIIVRYPTITVSIASSVAAPMVGSMYSLTCAVAGTERLTDAMVTYHWFKSGAMVSGQTMATLSFSQPPLTFSDAGTYTCQATVTSSLLSASITNTSSNSLNIQLRLPSPTEIRVTSTANPLEVHPIGSPLFLTCMADLDPAIDVAVAVDIKWSDPTGSSLNTTTPLVSGLTYTSTAMINSFGRSDSGFYTCSATIMSSPSNSFLSDSITHNITIGVTLGVYLSLRGIVYDNNSVIPITEIGETNSTSNAGLQCITDRIPCCLTPSNRFGEWYFPGRMRIVPGPQDSPASFYRNRGDDGTINLNRLNTNVVVPTGLYCCEVPDALNVMQRVCVNIIHTGVIVEVEYQLMVNEHSKDISFFLTCNSTGGQANSVVWTREGFLLHNTGPLVLTDAATLSYTNVLMVSSRIPGIYTCTIRGPNDQVLSSANFTVQGSAPPVNVVATRSSSSAPVEVSWSPPSGDGANIITGYRIFYGNGQNLFFSSYVTRIVLSFVGSSQIGSMSIRSESKQLPSELISVTVTIAGEQSSEVLCTCSSEVGLAVGVVLLVVGIIAVVAAVIVVSCWLIIRQRKSDKSDFAVSANMAYGQVKLDTSGDVEGDYEDPDRLARPSRQRVRGNYEPTGHPAPYELPSSKPETPVYATADETTKSGNKNTMVIT